MPKREKERLLDGELNPGPLRILGFPRRPEYGKDLVTSQHACNLFIQGFVPAANAKCLSPIVCRTQESTESLNCMVAQGYDARTSHITVSPDRARYQMGTWRCVGGWFHGDAWNLVAHMAICETLIYSAVLNGGSLTDSPTLRAAFNLEWPEYEGEKVFAGMSRSSVLGLLQARWRVEVASKVRDPRLPYFHEPVISQRDESRMVDHCCIVQLPSAAEETGTRAALRNVDGMLNQQKCLQRYTLSSLPLFPTLSFGRVLLFEGFVNGPGIASISISRSGNSSCMIDLCSAFCLVTNLSSALFVFAPTPGSVDNEDAFLFGNESKCAIGHVAPLRRTISYSGNWSLFSWPSKVSNALSLRLNVDLPKTAIDTQEYIFTFVEETSQAELTFKNEKHPLLRRGLDGPTGSLTLKVNLSRLLPAVRLALMTAFTSGSSPYEKDSSNRGYGYIVSRCSKLLMSLALFQVMLVISVRLSNHRSRILDNQYAWSHRSSFGHHCTLGSLQNVPVSCNLAAIDCYDMPKMTKKLWPTIPSDPCPSDVSIVNQVGWWDRSTRPAALPISSPQHKQSREMNLQSLAQSASIQAIQRHQPLGTLLQRFDDGWVIVGKIRLEMNENQAGKVFSEGHVEVVLRFN
ncbi:uncharacterized protein CLUP02_11167 [Colletotrichum lupini]|uniref:Uncharacterized protein n=1 Tax=Colletotrichum lupini TaxID=145971 RepID=A0A9Q8SYQ4_9PEZI|nr:uncharacterized protein CLUP02_11167 [Colletotrichum lupini]UQC85668.1 hypothetical protein CLUP02_11167 [Colletotrichum lupini]